MPDHYRSTEIYTVDTVVDGMGAEMVEVRNSVGMLVARLTPEQFPDQYELIPDEQPQ